MAAENGEATRPRPPQGAAAASAKAAAERRAASAELLGQVEAVARGVAALASRVTGLPGLGGMTAIFGAEDARKVAAMAGLTEQVAVVDEFVERARHRAEEVAQKQEEWWAGYPDHAPEYVDALARGAGSAELRQIRERVTAEIDERLRARPQLGPPAMAAFAERDRQEEQAKLDAKAASQQEGLEAFWRRFDEHRAPGEPAPAVPRMPQPGDIPPMSACTADAGFTCAAVMFVPFSMRGLAGQER
jgi:hypothetical protein